MEYMTAMAYRLEDMGKGSAPAALGAVVLLSRLGKQAYRRADEARLGIHLRHLVPLSYMRDHQDCPQQDLADAFCMDANNVVIVLNELEEMGYATRLRDPQDRRRHLVRLTDAGLQALAAADRGEGEVEEEILQALDADERATLVRLLNRALRGIEPADGQPAPVGAASA